ncbi:universal stress protein [Natronococcus pandeyae]|uniref:Universal stress protein n=1 Tax=Natronococcus pandeyae TaxID=2055836 RepID=A0A8J8Q7R7_9EURY|nr:universal stress protein [Natronococcus pandeyae]TYL40682.1 universal stress protein [Natronococcus pandeyae]
MYQDVLVPTDGSDGTRRAIAHALTIADRFDATVHALSIVPEGPLGTLDDGDPTTAARRAVERVEREARQNGTAVTTAVEHGVPHEEILAYVEDNGIDMVVMGTQGRTGLDRVLVGSVAERVVRLADVPVVTVRLTDEIRLEDSEAVERLARERAESDGYEDVSLRDEPHRTSASWTVPLETASGSITVQIDAVTADARITTED